MRRKLKTRRSIAKRFRFTASGKIRRAQTFRRHLLSARRPKRKRQLRRMALVSRLDEKRIRPLLPYG